jgi:hypothetical protein
VGAWVGGRGQAGGGGGWSVRGVRGRVAETVLLLTIPEILNNHHNMNIGWNWLRFLFFNFIL